MAVTSIWAIRGRVDKVINYAINPAKTENKDFAFAADYHEIKDVIEYAADEIKTEKLMFVEGINVNYGRAAAQFVDTKVLWKKTSGIVAYHGYQSFAKDEVDAKTAHEIGVKLAEKLWGDRFEVIVATHCNTGHYHNHFVINSVSYKDGKRYYNQKQTYCLMREESDRLCEEYGLSVVYDPQSAKVPYTAWKAEKEGKPSTFDTYRRDIDSAIQGATTMKGFVRMMADLGYEVVTKGKYPRFKEFGREKFHRFYKLGEDYTFEAITDRILRNYREDSPYEQADRSELSDAPTFDENSRKNFQTLYRNYSLEITFYKEHPYTQKRIHPLLREDLAKLDRIDRQTRFLGKTQIKTMDELVSYKTDAQEQIDELSTKRNELRNKLKKDIRAGNKAAVSETKAEISALSSSIRDKRKEMALCDGIAERTDKMVDCLSFMSEERKTEGKEKTQNEHIRRSGRTDRENES